MPRRKKYPKLPNGFGSIKKLSGKNRVNPYGVYPPTTEFDPEGRPVPVKAIAYVDDWLYGVSILTAYHAGSFVPGVYPPRPEPQTSIAAAGLEAVAKAILADYSRIRSVITGEEEKPPELTFAEVYERFYKDKYELSKKQYSESSKALTRAGFKNCTSLHDKPFVSLRHSDLQQVIDSCPLKHASLETIVSLFHQMYAFADREGICDKDYSANVKINIADDDEHGVPFSEDELQVLWQHQEDPVVEFLLIMCYSGYRIAAYKTMEVNLAERYFQGGVKTKAGKNRIVPIHSTILPLVKRRLEKDSGLLTVSSFTFRRYMSDKLDALNLPRHTPHDCRHTFAWLCEKYGVSENDRKRMLGHSFKSDITNAVYGHRTVEELRAEIEKIKACR